MRMYFKLPWYWRVPASLFALAYTVVVIEVLLSLSGIFPRLDHRLFRMSWVSLLGLALLWAVTISAYMSAGTARPAPDVSRADSCRALCAFLLGVEIAVALLCALLVASFYSNPTVITEMSFVVTAVVAISVGAIYAPLMALLVRAKLRRLAAEENRCYYCGVDLIEHRDHQQEHCEASTRRGMSRRRRELLRRRPRMDVKLLIAKLKQTGWWWYLTIAALAPWALMDSDWFEREFGDLGPLLRLAVPVVFMFWLFCIVPVLEAEHARFGKRGEFERGGGMLTPRARCSAIVSAIWLVAAWLSLHFILFGSLILHVLADPPPTRPTSALGWWVTLAPLLSSLLMITWALWATPRMEHRLRRSAWRALVCYDCGESLSGVSSPTCPQCEATIDRPVTCPRCGYDIAHLAGSACPECGQAVLPPFADGEAGQGTDATRADAASAAPAVTPIRSSDG